MAIQIITQIIQVIKILYKKERTAEVEVGW